MLPTDQATSSRLSRSANDQTQLRDMPLKEGRSSGAALAPTVLKSRFVLQDQLGSGGMGTVYRAKDLRKVEARDSNPYLAIKVLNSDFRDHPDAFIALQREAAKSQSLSHRNIVKIFDFDKQEDVPFMTMELLQGNELSDLLREYPQGLPEALGWSVIRGFCSALKHAHSEGVIHADLKPGNLFVTHAGQPKIFDFGLARAVHANLAQGVQRERSDVEDLVFDAAQLGALTPAFASRAMLDGASPNTSDDVFAAALVIYQVLTGKHPYNRVPADKIDPRSLSVEKPKQLSSRQWRGLSHALALDEQQRLPSVADLYSALFHKSPWPLRSLAAALGLAAGTLWYFNVQKDDEIRSVQIQAQQAGRVEASVDRISELIGNPLFDEGWERRVDDEIGRLSKIENSSAIIENARSRLAQLYIQEARELQDVDLALSLVTRGASFGDMAPAISLIETQLLERIESHLDTPSPNVGWITETERLLSTLRGVPVDTHSFALAQLEANASYLLLLENDFENLSEQVAEKLLRLLSEREFDKDALGLAIRARSSASKLAVQEGQRERAMRSVVNFGQQFAEQGCLVSNLDQLQSEHTAMLSIEGVDRSVLASRTDEMLASCVGKLLVVAPDSAASLQSEAASRFGHLPLTAGVSIDPCNRNYLIGSGAQRGKAGMCIDTGSFLPELVVIPNEFGQPYAVTRYEVSFEEYAEFCRATELAECVSGEPRLPVTGISISDAQSYAQWLTSETGYLYRLPSLAEWSQASPVEGEELDPNRNCTVEIAGVTRGGAAVPVSVGAPNKYGLVNAYGNVAEWVLDNGQLISVGGGFEDPIDKCAKPNPVPSEGVAAPSQGFRLLREILVSDGRGLS